MGNELGTVNNSISTEERELSYSSTFTSDITMRISSLDESLNRDKANEFNKTHKYYSMKYLEPPPPIHELNENNNIMDDDGNVTIGSYCYCDCKTVFALIIEIVNNGYKIIDLFEQRERIVYTNKLFLINDKDAIKAAKKQYNQYLMNNLEINLDA